MGVLAVAIGSLLGTALRAQQAAPVRSSVLRDDLSDLFNIPPRELLLNLPPVESRLLGSVLSVDPRTGEITVVDWMPRHFFGRNRPMGSNAVLHESVWIERDSPMFRLIFRDAMPPDQQPLDGLNPPAGGSVAVIDAPAESGLEASVTIRDIMDREIQVRDESRLIAELIESDTIREANRNGAVLMLVTREFVGRIRLELNGPMRGDVEVALPDFEFEDAPAVIPASPELPEAAPPPPVDAAPFERVQPTEDAADDRTPPSDESAESGEGDADHGIRKPRNILRSFGPVAFAYVARRILWTDGSGDTPPQVELGDAHVNDDLASPWERQPVVLRAVMMPAPAVAADDLVMASPEMHEPEHVEMAWAPKRIEYNESHAVRSYVRAARAPAPAMVEARVFALEAPDDEPAAANGHTDTSVPQTPRDTKEEASEVTVLYGTCRGVVVEMPSWFALWSSFIHTTNGWITAGGVALATLVVLLALGYAHKLNLVSSLVTLVICAGLYTGAGAIHAAQKYMDLASAEGVYGGKRGELRYGLCRVSVPLKRDPGELKTPFQFYLLRMPEDPEQHFVVQDLKEDREAFLKELKKRVAESDKRDAFVFIHGFNVEFGDAVKRTAQLCVDLKFQGAPICFTWPSQGEMNDYVADSTNAEFSAYKLQEFLMRLQEESGAKRIHLLAHSMGNDVLTRALREMKADLKKPDCVFREILLAAPDIDAELFRTQIVPAIRNDVQHITLYASENDRALKESYRWRKEPRAGMAGDFLVLVDGVETIDVSKLDTDFLGHSTYGDHPLAISDIGELFRNEIHAADRGLVRRSKPDSNELPRDYWLIEPPE